MDNTEKRAAFPKRVVITAGMPYGNKALHFGHIGGVFIQADTLARFMRDRIGEENVIFVSGTDCYGSPIVEYHRQRQASGEFEGSLEDFVLYNHKDQKRVLDAYDISPNLYGTSGFFRSGEIHHEMSHEIFMDLYKKGYVRQMGGLQFIDETITQADILENADTEVSAETAQRGVLLNGRQVQGRCPIQGCASEVGYADECALGHQYAPQDLIAPKSTLSGTTPKLVEIKNWYFDLPACKPYLEAWLDKADAEADKVYSNKSMIATAREFLAEPVLHVLDKEREAFDALASELPKHEISEGKGKSFVVVFDCLEDREKAVEKLAAAQIRYRAGKTLVPFRLSGNVAWGVPVPELDGLKGETFWVWPESLWAPISFTKTVLEHGDGRVAKGDWKDWWASPDASVYQIIGEDNVYFYGPAEMALFLATQGDNPVVPPPVGELGIPNLVVNHHLLFLDKKASSSGKVRPPMAGELLDYYTSDQLRAHFFSLGLQNRSVSFRPKPLNPVANEREGDPVLKEGNLLANVANRAIRTCFYTAQKYTNNCMPGGEVDEAIIQEGREALFAFEREMSTCAFHSAFQVVDNYIRNINKYWSAAIREITNADEGEVVETERVSALLRNTLEMVRYMLIMLHPIAPKGTAKAAEYFCLDDSFWSWAHIDKLFSDFVAEGTEFKFLEPRVDFYEKHPSQYN